MIEHSPGATAIVRTAHQRGDKVVLGVIWRDGHRPGQIVAKGCAVHWRAGVRRPDLVRVA